MIRGRYFTKSPPRERDEDARVLPLINIVFLLLIFFMVTGHRILLNPLDNEPVRSTTNGVPAFDRVVLFVDSRGQFAWNGRAAGLPEIESQLRLLSGEGQTDLRVSLQADARLDAVFVIGVMDRLRAAGAESLELLVLAEPR